MVCYRICALIDSLGVDSLRPRKISSASAVYQGADSLKPCNNYYHSRAGMPSRAGIIKFNMHY